ncbi:MULTISPECIES: nuclear transport factor 2 family protein [Pseudarthrobacter]|jgi:ketosteroid isomerase-like protein|uniref:Ketosteroid isomerase-like protein n=1 Tax=Pseudarthrobacter niigatensis TaxID=369935 RepID=A0AAJ1WIB5_9MICC|nr:MULTISPECIES: nuclear transport factor 2 family protein [Pseudarthrobacter]MDQ0147388.1 ketosteroid isomerase-like protein [Pseudarthrobacter niigatensis]MDQ0267205.1 ketosteroid isomerase-like protein [Pseudarthrobacter niigatensis]QDG60861.1 nuclear transport factor 2 family protein [Pseudarthrobacter sp. NIBRBAC000502771]
MGQARDAMDRLMAAMDAKDRDALAGCYAEDAVIRTPDQAGISGRTAIADYYSHFWEAMPDVRYERTATHEAGDVAVAEGFVVGTNTGQLGLPTGGTLPPTGRQVRVRSCDVTAVQDGVVTSHHAYFDQLELLGQLGLLPEPAQG